jgi:GTP-binding protein Era
MEKSVVIDGVDIVIHLVNPQSPANTEKNLIERFKETPVFLVINKIDTIDKQKLLAVIDEYRILYSYDEIIPVSALKHDNLDNLVETMLKYLPPGPMYYEGDFLTDQPEKFIVAEIIREKALYLLQDEIPHGVHVMVENMRRRDDRDLIDITATLYCEKDSHKGMIIGKKGSMLKRIGEKARHEIAFRLQCPVNLQIWVKVKKDWRNSDFYVRSFGYDAKKV